MISLVNYFMLNRLTNKTLNKSNTDTDTDNENDLVNNLRDLYKSRESKLLTENRHLKLEAKIKYKEIKSLMKSSAYTTGLLLIVSICAILNNWLN